MSDREDDEISEPSDVDSIEEETDIEEEEDVEELEDTGMSFVTDSGNYINQQSIPKEGFKIQIPDNFSEMRKKELTLLLTYRHIVQHVYKQRVCKIPANIPGVIMSGSAKHKGESPVTDVDAYISQLITFIEEKLPTAFTLNLKQVSKEIYDTGLTMYKIVIVSAMASKKVVGHLSQSAIDEIFNNIFNSVVRGIMDPGEMVGSEIATGLSEPLSQMTLNTFHLAGTSEKSKINSGMSRILQLLGNSKTDKIMNDLYMLIYFRPQDEGNNSRMVNVIAKYNKVTMLSLMDRVSIVQDPNIVKSTIPADQKMIDSYLKMKKKLPNLSILSLSVEFGMTKMFNARFSIFDIEASLVQKYPYLFILHMSQNRIRIFLTHKVADELEYWKRLIGEFRVLNLTGVEGIKGVDVGEEKIEYRDDNSVLKTRKINRMFAQGVNFHSVLSSRYVDSYHSTTNDIGETVKWLGISAGKSILYRELRTIYRANGTNPSPAIIDTLVHSMTCRGFISPINSIGMKMASASTIQQITFEKPDQVLTDSAIFGKCEKVTETSDNILFAQPFSGGTGAFRLIF